MAQSRPLFLGMDVHKESIAVASVAHAHGADVTFLGTIGTRQCASASLLRKMPSKATHLIFVSAAGPCGSWLSRYRTKQDDACGVVAPALLPQKPGDRGKTDRTDAMQWARLARSGDLPVVDVPQVDEEALRALARARADTLRALQAATLRLKAFLLRHALRYPGRAPWGPAPLRGLSEVVCPPPAQHIVFPEDVRAVTAHPERRQRLDHARHAQGTSWRLPPVVEALQALRGVQCTAAVTMVAEMGALPRFESPRALRQFLGLLPAEYISAERRRQGAIPQAGTTQARSALVAGAGASRSPAQGSRPIHLRREKHPKILQDISWKAQGRRCQRSRQLSAHGKHATGVTVAIARALAGCMWARAQQVPVTLSDQDSVRRHDALRRMADVHRTRRSPGGVEPSAALRGEERTREPRARQAPDGGQDGGRQPPERRRSNRRLFLAPSLPMHRG